MEHGVVGNGVVLGIAALLCGEHTADSRLLVQDVVELQGDGEGIALEEALGELCVPDELVGVHGVVVITTTALHVHVGGDGGAPRSVDAYHAAIGERPGVEVVGRLELAAVALIVDRTVQLDFEPVVAVARGQTLANAKGVGDAALRLSTHAYADISHTVVIAEVGGGVDVEEGGRVEG